MTHTASDALGALKAVNSRLLWLVPVVGVLLIVAGLFAQNVDTTVYYAVFAVAIGGLALIGRARIRTAEDLERAGTVGVQQSWITASLGLAFLSLIPSTFFSAPGWVKAVAAVAGAIWTLAGIFGLRENTSKANVPLSI